MLFFNIKYFYRFRDNSFHFLYQSELICSSLLQNIIVVCYMTYVIFIWQTKLTSHLFNIMHYAIYLYFGNKFNSKVVSLVHQLYLQHYLYNNMNNNTMAYIKLGVGRPPSDKMYWLLYCTYEYLWWIHINYNSYYFN